MMRYPEKKGDWPRLSESEPQTKREIEGNAKIGEHLSFHAEQRVKGELQFKMFFSCAIVCLSQPTYTDAE